VRVKSARDAARLRDGVANLDMDRELGTITAVAEAVLFKLKVLKPGALEIEFGVELRGAGNSVAPRAPSRWAPLLPH